MILNPVELAILTISILAPESYPSLSLWRVTSRPVSSCSHCFGVQVSFPLLLRHFLSPSLESPLQKVPTCGKCGPEFQVFPSPSHIRNDSLQPQNKKETHNLRQTLGWIPRQGSKGGNPVYDEQVVPGHCLLLLIFKVPGLSQKSQVSSTTASFLGNRLKLQACVLYPRVICSNPLGIFRLSKPWSPF